METMYPAATFTATRDELLDTDPLLGSAEIARGVCRNADRTISVLAITPDRMRRVDGWLGPIGFVTHAAAPDPSRPLLGSVCDRDRADELVDSIIGSLVGEIPSDPAAAPTDVASLGSLAPNALPTGTEWVVIVSAAPADGHADRTVIASNHGLSMGDVARIDDPVVLAPVSSDQVRDRLGALIGRPPRSIGDLLADD